MEENDDVMNEKANKIKEMISKKMLQLSLMKLK